MLRELGATPDAALPPGAQPGSRFTVTVAKEDLSEFTDEGLRPYAMIFWCNPTGTVFTSAGASGATGMAAVQKFLTGGGAWGGVHSATDFENTHQWPWFQDEVNGGNFASHEGDGTPGTMVWEDGPVAADHPVIRGIRSPWSCTDEWYHLNRDPATLPGFSVLGRLAGDQRPSVWVREIPGGGRSFYTIRGHNITVYAEPSFRRLVHQGILWAVRRMK
jgi:type 1 glutamine amidotransferase